MTAAVEPVVAAAVINFRTADLALNCVRSVRASKDIAVNTMVIDCASGDGSARILQQALGRTAGVSIWPRDVNDGFTGAANAAVTWARQVGARYLLLLNADTTLAPDCVRALVDEAEREDRVALVNPRIFYGEPADVLWFDGGRYSPWLGHAVHGGHNRRADGAPGAARDQSFATGCAMLVRLSAVSGVPFDRTLFAYAEDVDLSLRLRAEGWRLRLVPAATVWHHEQQVRQRPGGEATRFYFTTRNLLRVAARHARWYHWPTLAPMLAVGLVGKLAFAAVRRGNVRAFAAVWHGALHALTGGRSIVERAAFNRR